MSPFLHPSSPGGAPLPIIPLPIIPPTPPLTMPPTPQPPSPPPNPTPTPQHADHQLADVAGIQLRVGLLRLARHVHGQLQAREWRDGGRCLAPFETRWVPGKQGLTNTARMPGNPSEPSCRRQTGAAPVTPPREHMHARGSMQTAHSHPDLPHGRSRNAEGGTARKKCAAWPGWSPRSAISFPAQLRGGWEVGCIVQWAGMFHNPGSSICFLGVPVWHTPFPHTGTRTCPAQPLQNSRFRTRISRNTAAV